MTDPAAFERDLASAQASVAKVLAELDRLLIGQAAIHRLALAALIADGHVLLEGLPGLGKTQLIRTLARALDVPLGRVQGAPDLLPSDITGFVLPEVAGREPRLAFQPGPVFAPLILVDELNRTPPRAQSALLQAMEERRVTLAGTDHLLPVPGLVLATQNPIDAEGTYPLPDALRDRFSVCLVVGRPAEAELVALANVALAGAPSAQVIDVAPSDALRQWQALAQALILPQAVTQAAARLVERTWTSDVGFFGGASPRAMLIHLRIAKSLALIDGRAQAGLEDLKASAGAVYRHRLQLPPFSALDMPPVDALIADLVDYWWRYDVG